jgi:hypothetical protein
MQACIDLFDFGVDLLEQFGLQYLVVQGFIRFDIPTGQIMELRVGQLVPFFRPGVVDTGITDDVE